jgi:HSP20 family molecular chaperone IbpA
MTAKLPTTLRDLHHSLLGFDYLTENFFDTSYPRHNTYKTEEGNFVIELLVPGLTKDDVNVTFKAGLLTIEAAKMQEVGTPIHKGFSGKAFKKQMSIDPAYEVKDVILKNGVLSIFVEKNKVESEFTLEIKE